MDLTHFTQDIFRKLVDCFARPGTTAPMPMLAKVNVNGLYDETMSVMMALLDGEVSFCIASTNEQLQKDVRMLTGAKITNLAEADFIVIPHDATVQQVETVFRNAKTGDLIDPQKSATILYEVAPNASRNNFSLQGPGIKTTYEIAMGISQQLMEIRAMRNKEFPLGIDLIMIDKQQEVYAIPRTTVMTEVAN